jgi:RHS repeat-associated protein
VGHSLVDGGKDGSERGARYEYDPLGRLVASIDALDHRTETRYDAVGNTVAVATPAGVTSYAYDLNSRLQQSTNALGQATSFTYDANGNLLSTRDAEGRTTTFYYDALGRKIGHRDALGHETLYDYDEAGNLVQLTDANGGRTRFTYDANNRRTSQTRPEGEQTTYFYNEINQVRAVVYGGGHQVVYRYNGLGLPDTVKYYGPSASNLADKTVRYDYDVNGNLLSYTDGTTSADYLYDDLHRKISETVHYPHFSKTYTVDFPDNWHIDFTGPDGVTVTSSYDAGMRLSEISVPGAGSFDFTNYDWARPQTITLPTNTTIHKSYDALMRTTGILVQDSAATQIMSRTLSYDKVGNLLAKQTEHGLYRYSYDELNRLTDALNPGLPDEHFTYDPLGNRLTDNGVSGPLSYNRNNELTSLGGVTLSYDDNGNMVANNWPGIEQRYVYDETKRLKQIKDPTGAVTAEYYYDPFGRRLWKEVDGARTYFMYSGEGLIAEFDDNGTQIRGYGYAMGSTWTTNPLWLKEGGDYYFYLNDHLGTPQKIIDAAGEVVWAARYDSFGNAIIDIDTITNPLRFPGQYYDEESGLHYNWNRYYDPFLGRYIQSDPLGLDAGINFFVYAGNRPLTVIDPKGLCFCFMYNTPSEENTSNYNRGSSKYPYEARRLLDTRNTENATYSSDEAYLRSHGYVTVQVPNISSHRSFGGSKYVSLIFEASQLESVNENSENKGEKNVVSTNTKPEFNFRSETVASSSGSGYMLFGEGWRYGVKKEAEAFRRAFTNMPNYLAEEAVEALDPATVSKIASIASIAAKQTGYGKAADIASLIATSATAIDIVENSENITKDVVEEVVKAAVGRHVPDKYATGTIPANEFIEQVGDFVDSQLNGGEDHDYSSYESHRADGLH